MEIIRTMFVKDLQLESSLEFFQPIWGSELRQR